MYSRQCAIQFVGGTIVYNKYKYINHKTYAWQAQVTGCTITGAPGAIRIHAAGVYLAGGVWQNPSAKIMTSTVDFGGSLYNLVTQLNLDTSGGMVVDCNINGIAWGAATGVNFNINLIAEV